MLTAWRQCLLGCVAGGALVVSAYAGDALSNGDAAYRRGDYAVAARWYAKAVQAESSAWAEYNLGFMYHTGLGVPKDDTIASRWLAFAQMHPEMHDRAAALLATLASEQPSQARAGAEQRGAPAPIDLTATEAPGADQTLALGEPGVVQDSASKTYVPLQKDGGTFVLPVKINDAITLDFTLDSGAADVSIPADVMLTLVRAGTISKEDLKEDETVAMADGTTSKSGTFVVHSLTVGDVKLSNVTATIAPATGFLLLGQSFLSRLKSWSIDNTRQMLVIEGPAPSPGSTGE